MMTKGGSTKIVNFMQSLAGVLMVGCGHISHYNDYGLSSILSIYSTLVAIILREYSILLLFNAIVEFLFNL